MRHLALIIIMRLGRYAVLPVVALACLVLAIWLLALDRYTVTTLATAPLVFSIFTASMALAIGLLFLPCRKHEGFEATEAAAPGLWSIWKEVDRGFARPGRTLLIDTDFNASIGEVRRYAGLFGRRITMTVGLPVLIVLDERALRAIIAHEVAHAELRHTSGSINLADFIAASENVLFYADPERTITGRVARALLRSMLSWLEQKYRALSRENELCADLGAVERVGRAEVARALVLMHACRTRLTDLVYAPLEKDMLGAISAPRPPLQRMLSQLGEIRSPEPLAAAAAAGLTREPEPDATHPSFARRLANLGYANVPEIDPVGPSAIDRLLRPDAARDIPAHFDEEWRKKAQAWVTIGR
jgi:Zn-dependent protease with chaperone function